MRKINMSWQSVLLSVALLGLAACTGDFEDINRNPNQVTEEQMDALNYKTGTKFKSLQSLVIPVQEHMYQFNESLSGGPFGGYIGATVDTWQTKFETYNPSADWRKWPFANVITETYTPYKGIVNGTEDEVAIAFARLLRVAIMHRVTDSYGPIPIRSWRATSLFMWSTIRRRRSIRRCSRSWTRLSRYWAATRRSRPKRGAATTASTTAISRSGSNMPIRSSCAWPCVCRM